MKRWIILLLIAGVMLSSACASKTEDPPAQSPSETDNTQIPTEESIQSEPTDESTHQAQEPGLRWETTYETVNTYRMSQGTIWAQVIVEITNTGSVPLSLDYASFDLSKEDGTQVLHEDTVSAYPRIVDPGEKGYYYQVTALDLLDEERLALTFAPEVAEAGTSAVRYDVQDTKLSDSRYGGVDIVGQVRNNTGEAATVYVAAVLYNEEDEPIAVLYTLLTETLPAGVQTGFELSSFMLPEAFTATEVAHFDVFSYPLQQTIQPW